MFKNKEHYQYFNISRQSASRELNELAKQNILIKEKDKKQTFLQLIQKIGVRLKIFKKNKKTNIFTINPKNRG